MSLVCPCSVSEPLASPEDPYPRLQVGLGTGVFWEEPHVISVQIRRPQGARPIETKFDYKGEAS